VPLAPLAVAVRVVDQIARVEREGRARRLTKRLTEDTRPVRAHVVLRVAEIDKGELLRVAARRAKVKPLAPIHAIAHAVGVERVGHEAGEFRRMIVRLAKIGLQRLGARRHRLALERATRLIRDGKLRDRTHDRRIRAPCDSLRRRGIAAPRQHDAVGQGPRREREFVSVERRRDVRMAFVRGERERAKRGEEWEGVGEVFHGRAGVRVMA
jgi:hypothetical protein